VFRPESVAEGGSDRQIVHEHDRRLASAEGRGDPFAVGSGCCQHGQARRHRLGECGRVGHEHRRGKLIVLGLAEQVGGDEQWVGGSIRYDENVGRPSFGIDAGLTANEAFGGGNIDVAGAGDDLHRVKADALDAVGESADRAGAAHGVNFIDTEQPGDGKNGRVYTAGTTFMTTLEG